MANKEEMKEVVMLPLRDFQRIKYSKKNKRQHFYKNDNHYEGEKGVADGNPFLPPQLVMKS